MPGVLLDSVKQWIVQSLNQKTIVVYKDLQIQASFATYNRWQRLVYDEPRTGQRRVNGPLGTWAYVPYAYTERVERRKSLESHRSICPTRDEDVNAVDLTARDLDAHSYRQQPECRARSRRAGSSSGPDPSRGTLARLG